MFCYQCEQTKDAKGCTTVGVCGKTPEVAKEQDVLMHALKQISTHMTAAQAKGTPDDREMSDWLNGAVFSTLTNVNFDSSRFADMLGEANKYLERAQKLSGLKNTNDWKYVSVEEAVAFAEKIGVESRVARFGADYAGLQSLCEFGIKGLAAYADHAQAMGKRDDGVRKFVYEAFTKLSATPATVPLGDLLQLALDVGKANLRIMELLDSAHTDRFGSPEPTRVRTTPVAGKCVVVSGHDLPDLELVLKATEGKGINVYSHGEILPAHGYPGLKKYKHFVGNYGSAWQNQKMEFNVFPGPIVMTSNCITEPAQRYKDRIFTRHTVGWPGVKHIKGDDMSEVVKAALEAKGFTKDEAPAYTMTGFGHNAVLSVADKVIEAVKSGAIKHFFLIGGCDGAEAERNYFRDLAMATPKDTMILTLACGKYRFNKLEHGTIGPFPRMLDVGQCNDAFGAIKIATSLASAFKTDVNSLPLSFSISWFEQKAVAVLCTLLYLGVKNIYLGPALPAFITPAALDILVQKFAIKPIGNAQDDLKAILTRSGYYK